MKRLRIAGIILLFSILVSGCQATYISRLGYQQLRFIMSRRPVEQVLREGALSEEQKEKIKLILAAKAFAERDMGLKTTQNYTMYVHLDRNVLAYILTAAPKDRLETRKWWFPIVGSFPYKGFFDRQALAKERARLEQEEDLDTFVQLMAAYSTLGWFLDPIFSTYMVMDDYDLVDMVIHESVHLTLFVKGNMSFNEQMATFLGRMGSIEFLERHRGKESSEAQKARYRWADDLLFAQWIKKLLADLSELYGREIARDEKIRLRESIFKHYQEEFRGLSHQFRTDEYRWIRDAHLNNAMILAMRTYMDNMDLFLQAYEMAGRDLKRLVKFLAEICGEKGDPLDNLRRKIAEGLHVPVSKDHQEFGYLGIGILALRSSGKRLMHRDKRSPNTTGLAGGEFQRPFIKRQSRNISGRSSSAAGKAAPSNTHDKRSFCTPSPIPCSEDLPALSRSSGDNPLPGAQCTSSSGPY